MKTTILRSLYRMLFSILLILISACSRQQAEMDIVSLNKGKVMVVLLGMKGCPGTEAATVFLTEYSKTKEQDVVVCRVDVPPPGGTITKEESIGSTLKYHIDDKRLLADKLDFFFYPTLYIIDRDGLVRFVGECEPDKVKQMVSEIRMESGKGKKKMYTHPLLDIGASVTDLRFTDSRGQDVMLKQICGEGGALLLFSATTCPYSVSALDDVEKLKKDFKGQKLKYVIVSLGQDTNEIKDVYATKSPDSLVVIDSTKNISKDNFGVSAVPYVYIIDKDLKVVSRSPFVYDSAKSSVAKMLGMEINSSETSKGAG